MTNTSSSLGFEAEQISPCTKVEAEDVCVLKDADNLENSVKSSFSNSCWIDQDRCSNRVSALNYAFMRANASTRNLKEAELQELAKSYLAFIESGSFS